MASSATVVPAFSKEATLKREIRRQLKLLGFVQSNGSLIPPVLESKEAVRTTHLEQRTAILRVNRDFIASNVEQLACYFANGSDLDVSNIKFRLERVRPNTKEARLFRLASLTWSVPVSNGFGRRLRYLVWDQSNGKLAGIFALGDPVYNSSVRESAIGWSAHTKKQNLINVLDAYVLGSLPPYNALLAGKVIACMVRTKEVVEDFRNTYGSRIGIISQEGKRPELLAVTTSSSMGRSSVYNRLRLAGQNYFEPIGFTKGWGHFHFSDELFSDMRDHLRSLGHTYADQNRFGNGPNWKMRAIRTSLELLGFDPKILRHGIKREAFICKVADNSLSVLNSPATNIVRPEWNSLLDAEQVAGLGYERWVGPRAASDNRYLAHDKNIMFDGLHSDFKECVPVRKRNK